MGPRDALTPEKVTSNRRYQEFRRLSAGLACEGSSRRHLCLRGSHQQPCCALSPSAGTMEAFRSIKSNIWLMWRKISHQGLAIALGLHPRPPVKEEILSDSQALMCIPFSDWWGRLALSPGSPESPGEANLGSELSVGMTAGWIPKPGGRFLRSTNCRNKC